tara:strand:+ start:202 stop:813 length:612 start_codon:yes stop_codon:yes gene_type:complete
MRRGGKLPIRAQHFTLGQNVDVGTELVARLGILKVGNSSIKLLHEINRIRDNAMVAQALVTCVHVGTDSRALRVPDDLRERVDPSLLAPETPGTFEDTPSDAYSTPITIRNADIDMLQHVNQARYIEYMGDTRVRATTANAYGANPPQLSSNPKQIGIEYNREVVFGDNLIMKTWRGATGAVQFAGHVGNEKQPRFRAWAHFE